MINIPQQIKLRVERARARFGLVDIAIRVFKRYSEDEGGPSAAALTYFTFFSIFPMLLFGAALLGWVSANNPELQQQVLEAGVDAFPMISEVLEPEGLEFIQNQASGFAITGVVLALYAGSGGIGALQHALNKIYRVKKEPGFVPKRLKSLMWLGILGVGAVLTVGSVVLFQYAGAFFESLGGSESIFTGVAGHLVGFGVGLLLFATAYRFLPAVKLGWRDVLPGAIAAAIGLEVLKEFGATYLAGGADSREATFGVFAAAAGLLVASYLLCQLILLCAEINAVLAERRAVRQSSLTRD